MHSFSSILRSFYLNFTGIEMTPSNDVTISRGSKVNVICRSERKRSRFMWFMNGQLMTSRSKISTFNYGASVLRLNARDLERESTYVTCFVPPFTPKRIKIINVDRMLMNLIFPYFIIYLLLSIYIFYISISSYSILQASLKKCCLISFSLTTSIMF